VTTGASNEVLIGSLTSSNPSYTNTGGTVAISGGNVFSQGFNQVLMGQNIMATGHSAVAIGGQIFIGMGDLALGDGAIADFQNDVSIGGVGNPNAHPFNVNAGYGGNDIQLFDNGSKYIIARGQSSNEPQTWSVNPAADPVTIRTASGMDMSVPIVIGNYTAPNGSGTPQYVGFADVAANGVITDVQTLEDCPYNANETASVALGINSTGTGATFSITNNGTYVTGVTVTNGGSGYPPTNVNEGGADMVFIPGGGTGNVSGGGFRIGLTPLGTANTNIINTAYDGFDVLPSANTSLPANVTDNGTLTVSGLLTAPNATLNGTVVGLTGLTASAYLTTNASNDLVATAYTSGNTLLGVYNGAPIAYTIANATYNANGTITGLGTGGGSGVPSIAGTANQIIETGSPGATTLSLNSTLILPGTLELGGAFDMDAQTQTNGTLSSLTLSGTFPGAATFSGLITLSNTTQAIAASGPVEVNITTAGSITPGFQLINPTAATTGTKVQSAGSLTYNGSAWASTPARSVAGNWTIEQNVINGTTNASVTQNLTFLSSLNGTTNVTAAILDSGGNLTLAGGLSLGTLLPSAQLATTGVSAATYGDATHSAQIAINAQGQITSASNVSITGGGGGGTTVNVYVATANTTWTSNTTMGLVNNLTFNGVSGTTYSGEAVLYCTSSGNLGAGGISVTINGTATASLVAMHAVADNPYAYGVVSTTVYNSLGGVMGIGGFSAYPYESGGTGTITLTWTVVCSGNGTIQVQASQNSSNSASLIVEAGSTLNVYSP
jgi:hypothetical protein